LKKILFLLVTVISLSTYSKDYSVNIYTGFQNGNWRIRDVSEKESLKNGAYHFSIEIEKELYEHIYFLGGIAYENGYKLKNSQGSYDIIPLYIGGRYTYHDGAKWNPYISGKIGYPIFTNKKDINLNNKEYNGWANFALGLTYLDKYMMELGYKQHITNYAELNDDYDVRLFSISIGYRLY